MAISIKKYVDITSGVGAGAAVKQRDLILRIYTTNAIVPPKSVFELTTLEDVGTLFGTTSDEYLRASFYFGFVSKQITKPKKISFGRFVSTACAPRVTGESKYANLATIKAAGAGKLVLKLDGVATEFTIPTQSGAASFAAVATAIQTVIRANAAAQYATATVLYDASRSAFTFVGGATGDVVFAIGTPSSGVDYGALLGWKAAGAIVADGSDVETLTECMDTAVDVSSNFGSFAFVPGSLTETQLIEVAQWTHAQNNMYMFLSPVSANDASAFSADLLSYSGVGLTLSPLSSEFPELLPAAILAATDYSRPNASQNYMFYQASGLSPSVITTANSGLYDGLRINYYGRTQTAGQKIDFYQRGKLMGGSSAAVDMNTFANEMWLKDKLTAELMSLLLNVKVSANNKGKGQVTGIMQPVIDQAKINGVISAEKELTSVQKTYITELSNDPRAWQQVQSLGYWLSVVMESYVADDGATEWKAKYVLIYSKDDAIRKVEGSDVLI